MLINMEKLNTIMQTYEYSKEYSKINRHIHKYYNSKKENVCIIFTGAFNPFTPFHLELVIKSINFCKH